MTVNTTEIYKGKMRLHTVGVDKFKMSRFSISFICESDRVKTPLSRLMLAVMMRGSQKYPTAAKINKALDEQYGATVSLRSQTFGDKSLYRISCKLLKDEYALKGEKTDILESVMAILSDILLNPLKDENGLLKSSFVESEKKIAIDAIRAKINDPRSYASEQCSKIMFKDSKYEVVLDGSEELIEGFSVADVTENICDFFNNCRVEIFYVGSENEEHIAALIKKYFPFSKLPNKPIEYIERAFEHNNRIVKCVEETGDVTQGRLVLGYRCNTVLSDADYYGMALFNEIFGGGYTSKLFMNVREKESLCYYCYSSLHSATGTIKAGCGIDPLKKDDALNEIAAQLELMKHGDITEEEIETAKNTLISGVKQIYDSPAAIEAFFLRRIMAGMNDMPEDSIKRINAVERSEIVDAASKVELDTVYFMCGNMPEGEEEDYE